MEWEVPWTSPVAPSEWWWRWSTRRRARNPSSKLHTASDWTGCLHRIITEGFIAVTPQGLVLREVAPEVSVDDVCRDTEAGLRVDKDLKIIQV